MQSHCSYLAAFEAAKWSCASLGYSFKAILELTAMAIVLVAVVAIVAAFRLAALFFGKWVLVSRDLVRACSEQGIPGFSVPSANLTQRVLQPTERSLFQCWDALTNLSSNGKVFYVSLGKTVRLVVLDPLLLRELLISNADYYCKPSFVRVLEVLGNGLFSSSGDDWARQRQLLNPPFLNKQIKVKVQTMADRAIAAVERLNQDFTTDTKEVNAHLLFLDLTLDILQRTAFGAELGGDSMTILKTFDRYLHNKRRLVFGLASVIPGYGLVEKHLQEQLYQDEYQLRSLVLKIIDKHRALHHLDGQPQLIDVLLDAHDSKSITRKELLDNCITFLLAGHETTASLLTWTFYLLALNPLWQERARAEVSEFCQGHVVNWEDLSQLKTLALILMEVVRLFPPQPLIGRSCVKENKLGHYRIPAGLEVIVPLAAMHRNEELWGHDAAEFRPARFANGIQRACSHPLAYLPFGTGPRTCIGQALALTEAKVVLAILLPRYSWELSPSYQHCPDVTLTLQPKFGMPVILKRLLTE